MDLWTTITEVYPELTNADFYPESGSILLCNDSDGSGAYIWEWNYSKPLPDGLKLGK